MKSPFIYQVPQASAVKVGNVKIGGGASIVLQSMANTDTNMVSESVAQAKRIVEAGGQIIRFTTQGIREVENLRKIVELLRKDGIQTPIVADVHFSSKVARAAVPVCDKVRINPGNFMGKSTTADKPAESIDISPDGAMKSPIDETVRRMSARYHQNNTAFHKQLLSFLNACKEHKTAIRIGVNHGSLSTRIMDLYGDTPEGMVISALEYLEVCREAEFENVVVSLKSSNSSLMTRAVRLLVDQMIRNSMYFPLHLGVTESGDGLEGRIKSVVGIAPLLIEGIGDTIRISLTEPPENEIPVAAKIRNLFPRPESLPYHPFKNLPWNPFDFTPFRKLTNTTTTHPLVAAPLCKSDPPPDILVISADEKTILQYENVSSPIHSLKEIKSNDNQANWIGITPEDDPETLRILKGNPIILLNSSGSDIREIKLWLINFHRAKLPFRLLVQRKYRIQNKEEYALLAAGELGFLFTDRLVDGCWLENEQHSDTFNAWLSFRILQSAGVRITATEYIACPSCGRTLFDIQSVLGDVKKSTSHLKGLKIAVMGCIVNGPGEMADADYGYIGAGKGLVNIYKGKQQVRKNIPQEEAIKELESVIRENGDWVDP